MNSFFVLLIISASLFAADSNTSEINTTIESNSTITELNASVKNPSTASKVIIKDTSGLSEKQLNTKALQEDQSEQQKIVKESIKIEQPPEAVWEQLAPTPVMSDWLQLSSGEWLRGSTTSLYNKSLEFVSDKLGLRTFAIHDVVSLRTHKRMTVTIETSDETPYNVFEMTPPTIEATGIIRMSPESIKVIQGDNILEFPRSQMVSIVSEDTFRYHFWSGNLSLSLDLHKGNNERLDYSASSTLTRRTSKTILRFDYLGNFSEIEGVKNSESHRVNEKFDLFLTRYFFISPLISEYFRDPYQNIGMQLTGAIGIGYTLVDSKGMQWYLSGGPALVHTDYSTVESDTASRQNSWAFRIDSMITYILTTNNKLTLDYHFSFLDAASGNYKHHTITKLENTLTNWLKLNLSLTWDYVQDPIADGDGNIPYRNDYRFLAGLGIYF